MTIDITVATRGRCHLQEKHLMKAQTPGLDVLQLGHLRHFDNLSGQPANDWSLHMPACRGA